MYVAKPGKSCTICACMLEYTCLLFLGGYLGSFKTIIYISSSVKSVVISTGHQQQTVS